MDWLQVVLLALIQGITEFLPISSSAHLILPAQLTDWPDQGLAFDVAVHLGTLIAVIVYFRSELFRFITATQNFVVRREADEHFHELLKIGVATLPIVVLGYALKDLVAVELRTTGVIATTTILFGGVLWFADRRRGEQLNLTYMHAFLIGLAQAIAIVPGTSRSGITITAALLLGLSRPRAAEISFLLAIPTIMGAALLMSLDLRESTIATPWSMLATGALLAGLAAFVCIRYFIALIDRTGMLPYVVYRMLLGLVLILLMFS